MRSLLLLVAVAFLNTRSVYAIPQKGSTVVDVRITANLDPASELVSYVPDVPSINKPAKKTDITWENLFSYANFTFSVSIKDRRGDAHVITVMFFHSDVLVYNVRCYVDSGDLGFGLSGYPRQLSRGFFNFPAEIDLRFEPDGILQTNSSEGFSLIANLPSKIFPGSLLVVEFPFTTAFAGNFSLSEIEVKYARKRFKRFRLFSKTPIRN